MRLKILFSIDRGRYLSFNYPYFIGSWLYKQMALADEQLASFLHERGYPSGRKQFKLFTFSGLKADFRVENGLMGLGGSEASLMVNFYLEAVAEQFVKGVFMEQAFSLGDKQHQVHFTVQGVESMGMPHLTHKVQFRLHSPLVVGRKNERGNDDYLGPEEPGYADFLMQNLMDKYVASGGVIEPAWQNQAFDFTLLRYHKKPHRLVTVKEGTPAATRVKGYLFDFELTAPVELIEVGLLAGFGRENAMGFGYAEVVKNSTNRL